MEEVLSVIVDGQDCDGGEMFAVLLLLHGATASASVCPVHRLYSLFSINECKIVTLSCTETNFLYVILIPRCSNLSFFKG